MMIPPINAYNHYQQSTGQSRTTHHSQNNRRVNRSGVNEQSTTAHNQRPVRPSVITFIVELFRPTRNTNGTQQQRERQTNTSFMTLYTEQERFREENPTFEYRIPDYNPRPVTYKKYDDVTISAETKILNSKIESNIWIENDLSDEPINKEEAYMLVVTNGDTNTFQIYNKESITSMEKSGVKRHPINGEQIIGKAKVNIVKS
ncbi:hypothetical protein HOG98_03815 [bacterium]|jgi:hypothetical protein|nr:hypothetical protein [bacterium]